MTKTSTENPQNGFNKVLQKIDEKLGTNLGGEIISGFVAVTLFMFIQIASINSRHMAVAFAIPSETTGIYFTKLYSVRWLVNLAASITTYIIKLFISEDNIYLTLVFSSLILISRTIFMVFLYAAKNKALYTYNIYILDAVSIGLFQMTFYPLTAEYVSAISLCFKISRLVVFLIQLGLDLIIFERPFLILQIHYWLAYLMTLTGTILWFYYCISRKNKSQKRRKSVKPTCTTDEEPTSSSQIQTNGENTNNSTNEADSTVEERTSSIEEKVESTEPGFLTHLGNAMSPLLMCLVTLIMKNILWPGVLPYGILDRDKCHLINMVITPVGLLGTTIIHITKKKVASINRSWDWYWHLIWFLVIPPAVIFYKTIKAIHSLPLNRNIINNKTNIFIMAVLFFLCHTTIESAGYLGVVSNVKHCNEVRENGKKMVSTNQLLSEITCFISYKVSVGYNVTRISLGYQLPTFRPTHRMSKKNLCFYILRHIFIHGYQDFIRDFKMNIRQYI